MGCCFAKVPAKPHGSAHVGLPKTDSGGGTKAEQTRQNHESDKRESNNRNEKSSISIGENAPGDSNAVALQSASPKTNRDRRENNGQTSPEDAAVPQNNDKDVVKRQVLDTPKGVSEAWDRKPAIAVKASPASLLDDMLGEILDCTQTGSTSDNTYTNKSDGGGRLSAAETSASRTVTGGGNLRLIIGNGPCR
eukprot:GHVS01045489.1.p1 GENE.GHVS01045489.1~~GHVS01045489.1.p1  ORF type:complete len:193 (-),score=30.83 GHVS01045489.1:534-1112(-)